MKLVQTLLALALAGAMGSASAVAVGPGYLGDLVGNDVAISNSHNTGVNFSDIYDFDIGSVTSEAIATSVKVVLQFNSGPTPTTIYDISNFAIKLVDVNNIEYAIDNAPDANGNYSLSAILAPSMLGVPGFYQFVVSGTASGSAGGLYAGALSAAPVPEADTYAMMLAGLGLMGFMVSRRRSV